jgi:hypothetical protein
MENSTSIIENTITFSSLSNNFLYSTFSNIFNFLFCFMEKSMLNIENLKDHDLDNLIYLILLIFAVIVVVFWHFLYVLSFLFH